MAITSKRLALQICEALGINTKRLAAIRLVLDHPSDIARVEATYFIEEAGAQKMVELLKQTKD